MKIILSDYKHTRRRRFNFGFASHHTVDQVLTKASPTFKIRFSCNVLVSCQLYGYFRHIENE